MNKYRTEKKEFEKIKLNIYHIHSFNVYLYIAYLTVIASEIFTLL